MPFRHSSCWPVLLVLQLRGHPARGLPPSPIRTARVATGRGGRGRGRGAAPTTRPLHAGPDAPPTTAGHASPALARSRELGGDVVRIRGGPEEAGGAGFLGAAGVPTFAVRPDSAAASATATAAATIATRTPNDAKPKRLGLEGVLGNSNAFLIEHAVSSAACEAVLQLCENELKFGEFDAGKNRHGALQIVVSRAAADALAATIGPHVDLRGVTDAHRQLDGGHGAGDGDGDGDGPSFALAGVNRRWRVYRYAPDDDQHFAPHIDAGFPPGGVSWDDDDDVDRDGPPFLHWDASHQHPGAAGLASRLTVLLYLNEDFRGGHTTFYRPLAERDGEADGDAVLAAVRPRAGSILVFPQAVSEHAVERARRQW